MSQSIHQQDIAVPFGTKAHLLHLVANASRHGFSCVEVVVAMLILGAACTAGIVITHHFGLATGISAAALAAFLVGLLAALFYTWSSRIAAMEIRELEECYPAVYRVLSAPSGQPCVIAAGSEIRVGDYGWEAEPIYNDGHVYLQGLTEEWNVAWYAGFRPEQIERVGGKPRSQYYLPYSWNGAGTRRPPCPYPVHHSSGHCLGLPQRVNFPFVQGVNVKR